MATAWDDIRDLYKAVDATNLEKDMLQGLDLMTIKQLVKDDIKAKLLLRFEAKQLEGEILDEDFQLLDNITDYTVLRKSATYWAIYLIFTRQALTEDDTYNFKAKQYLNRFNEAFEVACRQIRFNSDESHTGREGQFELVW